MKTFCAVVTICYALFASPCPCRGESCFPTDFLLGTVTSNYQHEGAWNVSGKSESTMDHWTHEHPEDIDDRSNGDVAADSYHKYEEDVELAADLGVNAYRFSISWARVLPNGYANNISADGLAYYKNLTQALINKGIKPIVILHHMDHPQSIEDMGGWLNELIVDMFVDYARVIFKELGSMVDTWVTINQPYVLCYMAYEADAPTHFAPAKRLGNYAKYQCMHNALKAHAKVWHLYNDEFRAEQNGKVGSIQSCFSYWLEDENNPDDVLAAELGFEFNCGWAVNPLLVGDYPEIVKTRVDAISEQEGYSVSRLPKFTDEEIAYINGTADFIGLNFYRTYVARLATDEEIAAGIEYSDRGIIQTQLTNSSMVAAGLISLLKIFRDKYGNPPVLISENGYGNSGGTNDTDRISYFHDVLTGLLSAITDDGANVFGYLVWTLLDAFELFDGYTVRFGLYNVDVESENRTRTAKLSASWWKSVIAARAVQPVP